MNQSEESNGIEFESAGVEEVDVLIGLGFVELSI